MRHFALLLHGDSGAGKTRLADNAPGPRLVLDAEGGSEWTDTPKAKWHPSQPLPTEDEDGNAITTNTTIICRIRQFGEIEQVLAWLQSGNHYFETVTWDSLTDIQKRCKESIKGPNEDMTERKWGALLDRMEYVVRAFRDLKDHPSKPTNVIFTALTLDKDHRRKPDVQGALSRQMTSYVDITGYLFWTEDAEGTTRHMCIRSIPVAPNPDPVDAKDRTDKLIQKYGTFITNPSMQQIAADLNERSTNAPSQ